MQNRKIFHLLRSLSPAERRRFKKWLVSPIHNTNILLSKFYTFLDTRSDWTERSLKPEKVFVKIFGNIPFDDLLLRRLLSDFFQQLEDFLVYENWHERPSDHALAKARIYRARQLPREAAARLQQAAEGLRERPERDARFYLDAYRLQEEKLQQASGRDAALNMQEMGDELNAFFAAELLRNACTATSHQAVYRADYHMPYLEAVLADCAAGHFDHIPVIRLYFLSYRCLTQPEAEADFRTLKSLLPDAGRWLPTVELRNVVTFAVNYCIRRLNTDAEGFIRDVFDLYQTGLQQGVFLENGVLSRFTFKNIVSASLKLGETSWTESFIRDYAPLLPAKYRLAYERFALAKLAYQQHDFDLARTLLHDIRFDDVFLDLDARVLLLKIYFETKEWRLLRGFLTAFERFVSRKKMLPYQAPNYLNIIHLTARIMSIHTGDGPVTDEELAATNLQIQSTQPLTERSWLETQLHLSPSLRGSSA